MKRARHTLFPGLEGLAWLAEIGQNRIRRSQKYTYRMVLGREQGVELPFLRRWADADLWYHVAWVEGLLLLVLVIYEV